MKKVVYGVFGLLMLCRGAMASLKGDAATVGAILADTFISTSSEGKVRTKDEMLADMKSGEFKFQISIIRRNESLPVRTRASSAADGMKFVQKGKTVDTVEPFIDTHARQNGQRRCVASHGSTIK